MLTGFPPFQSSSQDEIYRKAKNIEYDWPDNGSNSRRCHNDIPFQAKDLVSSLLKVDAETRPNPDGIVSHDFFSMHGGNAIPLALDPSCRHKKPSWLLEKQPRGDVMDKISPRLDLWTLAKECGVGQRKEAFSPYEVVGDNVDTSLYKECVAEERKFRSPVVPLPDDMVYCSTTSLKTWPNRSSRTPLHPDPPASTALEDIKYTQEPNRVQPGSEVQPSQDAQVIQVVQPIVRKRGPVQSHAATLRAAHAGAVPTKLATKPTRELAKPSTGTQRVAGTRRLLAELPVRQSSVSTSVIGHPGTASERKSSRVTRSATNNLVAPRPIAADKTNGSDAPEADKQRRAETAKNEARIAANVQEEFQEAVLGQRGSRRARRVPKVNARVSARESSLISPDEVPESLVDTSPKRVLESLKSLHQELVACLDSRSQYQCDHQSLVTAGRRSAKDRPVILKWVDYSHKFGIGYILENGTVGCVLIGENGKPPSCVAVAHSEGHCKRRRSLSYVDKHQIIHKDGAPVAFFEDCGEEGFRRVLVSPRKFQIRGDRPLTESFRRGTDKYDSEKRERLYMWEKFARYMSQHLGRNDSDESSPNPSESVGPFIKFYQRIGNVGVWGFGNGSFQFNFPDHTKLIFSPDGTWLDYYYLPIEAAQALKRGEILEAASLMERSVMRYPTSVMLKGSYQDHEFKKLILENELHAKVSFVKDIVGIWCEAGGLGRMGGKQGLKWEGMSEKAGKHVWVTIGAYGGDDKKYERRGS